MSAVALTSAPLDLAALTRLVAADVPVTGAIVSFLGVVRAESHGRAVRYLEYEAYEPLARRVFERIVEEAAEQWPGVRLGLHHRLGRLEVGEPSVAIVAAAAHRREAFAACRYAIERVKQIAPIWKKEVFEGGDVWVEGAVADPDDPQARQAAYTLACA